MMLDSPGIGSPPDSPMTSRNRTGYETALGAENSQFMTAVWCSALVGRLDHVAGRLAPPQLPAALRLGIDLGADQ